MRIRTFQPGDEERQAAIYNAAAAELPKFKPATTVEVQRRTKARDFDPKMRFYAEEAGQVVGYVNFNPNGRVSYPWCLKGHEQLAEPLFQHMMQVMRQRGYRQAFAAYRGDWPTVCDFFVRQGFQKARDMVNFILKLIDLPTAPARPSGLATPLAPADVPALLTMMPEALRVSKPEELEKALFKNPYFQPDALFALRGKGSGSDAPIAVGLLITEPTYADPYVLDANMPCFRLGAFGSEGMQTKRIKGMFSFLARKDQNVKALGLDLLGQANQRLADSDDIGFLAAQAPSDAPALMEFYQRNFRQQGSFPVFEKSL